MSPTVALKSDSSIDSQLRGVYHERTCGHGRRGERSSGRWCGTLSQGDMTINNQPNLCLGRRTGVGKAKNHAHVHHPKSNFGE